MRNSCPFAHRPVRSPNRAPSAKSHDDADHGRVFRVGALGRGRARRPSGPSSKRTPWSWGRCLSGAGKADRAPQIMHATCHSRLSLPPEILEPIRRQRCVDGGAGDRSMAEPALDRPDVVALVGEGVAQHVRVRLELQAGGGRGALDHRGQAGYRERGRIVPLGLAQIGQSKTTGGTTIFRFPKHAEQTIVLGSPSPIGHRRMGFVGTARGFLKGQSDRGHHCSRCSDARISGS
jgi:hypothetical protein